MFLVLVLIIRTFLAGLRPRRDLMLENLALRHQLNVALRTNPRLDSALEIEHSGSCCGAPGRTAGSSIFDSSDPRR